MSGENTVVVRGAPGIKGLIARHPLVSYFVIAFAGAWLAVLPVVLSSNHAGVLPFPLDPTLFVWLGAMAGPTLAAFLVTGATTGRTGVRNLLRRYVHWRVGIQWYLVALFGPFAVLTLGLVVVVGTEPLAALAQKWSQVLALLLAGTLLQAVIGGPLGEEPGWRGTAQPRLERRYGPLAGCLILGVLWGCWHLIAFFGGWLGIPFSLPAFLFLVLGGMAGGVLYGWVYNHTGSLLIAILLHASTNAATGVGGLILPASMSPGLHTLTYTYGGLAPSILAVSALLVVLFSGGRLGYRPEVIEGSPFPAPADPAGPGPPVAAA